MPPDRPGVKTEGPSPNRIHLWIRTREPLAGEVGLHGERPTPFEGWLELLERLSELVASVFPDAGPADRRGR